MPGNPLIAAIVVAVIAMGGTGWWFGVHRRRLAETSAGISALAGMKWRECAGLVLQALGEKGYREAPASRQPGDGGTEFLLVKGDERVLLSYKHGTAYRLGEANVRDFANAVQLQGATSGMLVTLGSAEGFARDIARRFGIELIDGRSLWPQVEPFAPAGMVEGIRTEAAHLIHRGQRLGMVASAALGLLVFVIGWALQDDGIAAPAPQVAEAPAATPAPASARPSAITGSAEATTERTEATIAEIDTPAPPPVELAADDPLRPEAVASREASAALQELEAVQQLSDEQRAQRRLAAAASVADLENARTAVWSTQSTLVIGMSEADGIDSGLVNDACQLLTQYEELRYTRLQLEPPSSDTSGTPVRWRQCQ